MKRSSLSQKHDRLQPSVMIEWVPRHLLENHLTDRLKDLWLKDIWLKDIWATTFCPADIYATQS